jgi:hypothetical protein
MATLVALPGPELEQGFERVNHISPNAMRQALQLLNIQARHPVRKVQGLGTMLSKACPIAADFA